ncbi:hypothetical protein WA538_000789 [Blastocystis sp. DL]
MAPRNTRRPKLQDDYTEEDDDRSSKRQKIDPEFQKQENEENEEMEDYENDIEYKEAFEALEKKRDINLLLIQTELKMRLENANTQAEFETKRINQFYEERVEDLRHHISEEQKTKTRSMTADAQNRQHRSGAHRFELNPPAVPVSSKSHRFSTLRIVEDQCGFTVPLTENEIIEDLLYMARDWLQVCETNHLEKSCIAVPLSYSRLLLNDHVIYPNTPCTVMSGGNRLYDCVFTSTMVKEKEGKEKKKDPEFVLKVSATRKRRFPIDSLRTGEMELVFKEEDLHSMNENQCGF